MIDAIKVNNPVNNIVKIIYKKSNKNNIDKFLYIDKNERVKPIYEGKSAKILKVIILLLEGSGLIERCKFRVEDFTRERVFTFKNIIFFIANLAKKSLKMELKNFATTAEIEEASKQAFSQARKKLNPIVFSIMNDTLIEEFYKNNEFSTFHGFRLFAIDGSWVQLPSSDELDNHYEKCSNKEDKLLTMAQVSVLFDVENKLTIHGSISPYKTSEKELAIDHIENLREINAKTGFNSSGIQDLIVFDRGYVSTHLIKVLFKHETNFIIRCTTIFVKDVRTALMNGKEDQIVDIKIANLSHVALKNLKKNIIDLDENETIKIRVLTSILKTGEKEILLTSLLDQEKYPAAEMFQLYNRRWDIEENYKFYKVITEMENFSGKSKIAIEQDFFATIFICNFSAILMQEAQSELKKTHKEKNLKYEYKINKSTAVGLLKNNLIEVLMFNKDVDEFCENMKYEMKRSIIPIRPGRSFPRKSHSRGRRYPSNMRSSI